MDREWCAVMTAVPAVMFGRAATKFVAMPTDPPMS